MAGGCVWGIDIGKSSLKAVRMREGREEAEILALAHLEYDMDEDGTIPATEATSALDELLRRHPEIRKERVLVSLPGQASFSRFIKLPTVGAGRVDEMVGFEAQQQIPFPIDEVVWDYALVEDEEAEDEQEVGLFAIKKELVYAFLGDLQLSGLEPDVLTIGPLATYNYIRWDVDYDEDKAVVVLDIGSDHTDLIVIDGERYWLRNLALSGQELTKAIATRTKQPLAEAEELKRSAADVEGAQAKKVYQSTQLVLRDFVSEIHRSIGFYKAQNRGRKVNIGEILLLGNGSKLPNIRPFFQRELGYPVKTVKRVSQLALDDDLGADEVELLKEQLPGLSVAFGLGIQGCGFGLNEVNLLPEEMQLKKALSKKKLPVAIAVILCFVIVGFAYMQASSSLERTEKVLADAKKHLRSLEKNESEIAMISDVTGIQADIDQLRAFTEGRNQPLEVLNHLALVLPEDNGRLVEVTPAQEKSLLQGRKLPLVQQVEHELKAAMDLLNREKLWLLELELAAASYAVGEVQPGERVALPDGRTVPVDERTGRFRTLVDVPVGRDVRLAVTAKDGLREERPFTAQAGVRATLNVAKLLLADEKATLEAVERELLAKIRERLPDAAFEGISTKIYALEPGANTPPRSSFGGVQSYQTFIAQKIVVDYPATDQLAGQER